MRSRCTLWLVAAGLALACPGASGGANDLAWPPPPNPPRIRYVQSLTGPVDLGIRRPLLRRLSGWVSGEGRRDRLIKPFGLALDGAGNLLVTDTGAGAVWWFNREHRQFHRWDKLGPYRLASPVAVARDGETFYVADSELAAVLAFDAAGRLRQAITNGLERPSGLAVADGKLFVADSSAHRIAVFDREGRRIGQFGQRGTEAGSFNFPTHLGLDRSGHLLVTDSMNARIQVLDQAGRPLGVIGSRGDSSGHFSRPKGVAADSLGHLYAADALFDNIQVFDAQGQLLLAFGATGQQPGQFWLPGGLAIGNDNRIYAADTYNGRVQVFQYVGEP